VSRINKRDDLSDNELAHGLTSIHPFVVLATNIGSITLLNLDLGHIFDRPDHTHLTSLGQITIHGPNFSQKNAIDGHIPPQTMSAIQIRFNPSTG
jgi:hypothetical protein